MQTENKDKLIQMDGTLEELKVLSIIPYHFFTSSGEREGGGVHHCGPSTFTLR